VSHCPWTGQIVHKSETAVCQLTGLRFSVSALNVRRELAPLRNVLDGNASDAQDGDALLPWLNSLKLECLRGAKHIRYVASPGAGLLALCVEDVRWLGLSVQYVGLVVSQRGERMVVCHPAVGRRGAQGWERR
jgi:hypothetical protein